jgi:hypothetical protein
MIFRIALARRAVYIARMSLKFPFAIVAVLSLLPVAASANGKRQVYHWHGYGFLPGYHQPPNNNVPVYGPRPSANSGPSNASSFTRSNAPSYWYGGGRYYFGNPGFLHGRFNGGSLGPCWTTTPIGLMWNCG